MVYGLRYQVIVLIELSMVSFSNCPFIQKHDLTFFHYMGITPQRLNLQFSLYNLA